MIAPLLRSRSQGVPTLVDMLDQEHALVKIWRIVMEISCRRQSSFLMNGAFTGFKYQYFFPCIISITEGLQTEIVLRLKSYYTKKKYYLKSSDGYREEAMELLGTIEKMRSIAQKSVHGQLYTIISRTGISVNSRTAHRHTVNSLQLVQLFASFFYLLKDFQYHLSMSYPVSPVFFPDPPEYAIMVQTYQGGIIEMRAIYMRLRGVLSIKQEVPSLLSLSVITILKFSKGELEKGNTSKKPLTMTYINRTLLINKNLVNDLSKQLEVRVEPSAPGIEHQVAFSGFRSPGYLKELDLLSMPACIVLGKQKLTALKETVEPFIKRELLEKCGSLHC
ncbi:hypothetical protein CLAVI_000297 [Candidatus Clavichlamydia salmonicola]|uniref:hypothetical protein n=1 Tax=Candidatus Clavichlamydia salmonicola TaxID=469812 RepID=UPI001890EF9E|nr:hypothetical protein [Candidatus Clavichlamydia salmonicola]MBF5050682.1 hypothetical protein [Candidatus Clavichlamydia salmonicola]